MKRLIAMVTCVMLLLTLLPLGAVSAADATAPVVVGGVPLQEGDYLAVDATAPQTTKPTGGYAHYKDGTLTLNNYTYEGSGYDMSYTIYRKNGNYVMYQDNYALIYCTITVTIHVVGENFLTERDCYGYMHGIYSEGSVTITAESDAKLNIYATKHGIHTGYYYGNPLTITGGEIRITGADYGIFTTNTTLLIEDCTLDIQADTCGIHVDSGFLVDEGYIAPIKENGVIRGYRGGLVVNSGRIKIRAIIEGIDSHHITVNDGVLDVAGEAHYSINVMNIVVNGGTVTSTGRGILASGDTTINGGTITAKGNTYGIYSQYKLTINGGNVTAIGKSWGILGYDTIINGGTVIAKGETQSGIYSTYIRTYGSYMTNNSIQINGGRVDATSAGESDLYWAIKSDGGQMVVNEDLFCRGAYAPDGELIPYDPADNKLYDRVVICGEHIYDGVCDGECNHCGATRTAKAHTWKNGKCADCGKASPTKVKLTAQSATARYAKAGATVSAKVTAKGDGLKYQWYVKNAGGTKYSKSAITKATYAVSMSTKVKGRRVYCVVTDQYGNKVTSKTFILRESVSITTQPKTVAVKKNATAKVIVKAKGDGLKYQWYYKNEGKTKYSKSSVTKATYTTTMNSKSTNRLVYCVITDKYGNKVQTKTVKLKMK